MAARVSASAIATSSSPCGKLVTVAMRTLPAPERANARRACGTKRGYTHTAATRPVSLRALAHSASILAAVSPSLSEVRSISDSASCACNVGSCMMHSDNSSGRPIPGPAPAGRLPTRTRGATNVGRRRLDATRFVHAAYLHDVGQHAADIAHLAHLHGKAQLGFLRPRQRVDADHVQLFTREHVGNIAQQAGAIQRVDFQIDREHAALLLAPVGS